MSGQSSRQLEAYSIACWRHLLTFPSLAQRVFAALHPWGGRSSARGRCASGRGFENIIALASMRGFGSNHKRNPSHGLLSSSTLICTLTVQRVRVERFWGCRVSLCPWSFPAGTSIITEPVVWLIRAARISHRPLLTSAAVIARA